MDDWFLAEPKPADSKQMQLLVQQTLARKQMQHKHVVS